MVGGIMLGLGLYAIVYQEIFIASSRNRSPSGGVAFRARGGWAIMQGCILLTGGVLALIACPAFTRITPRARLIHQALALVVAAFTFFSGMGGINR